MALPVKSSKVSAAPSLMSVVPVPPVPTPSKPIDKSPFALVTSATVNTISFPDTAIPLTMKLVPIPSETVKSAATLAPNVNARLVVSVMVVLFVKTASVTTSAVSVLKFHEVVELN